MSRSMTNGFCVKHVLFRHQTVADHFHPVIDMRREIDDLDFRVIEDVAVIGDDTRFRIEGIASRLRPGGVDIADHAYIKPRLAIGIEMRKGNAARTNQGDGMAAQWF